MWKRISIFIIKYRLPLLVVIGIITAFMGYHTSQVKLYYGYVHTVPESDPGKVFYENFKETFGEDGNVLAIGVGDTGIYELDNFRRFQYLCNALKNLNGINTVVALPVMRRLERINEAKKFELNPLFEPFPESQDSLNSLLAKARNVKFYERQLINPENGATIILMFLENDVVNAEYRQTLINDIKDTGEAFANQTGINLHYTGLPFVRSVMNDKIKSELWMFSVASFLVTALILLLLFRSWDTVIFPMIVIAVIIIWSLGTISLLGYQMTILTGLIPPIIVIIGIPNSVYLLNKYHQEYSTHRNKILAITNIIQKIGIITLITNLTTSIGFAVLVFTNIDLLIEFGIVAGVNIIATFIVSLVIIPTVFSYLPPPSDRQLRHLKFRPLDYVLNLLDLIVHKYRPQVFIISAVVLVVSVIGLFQIKAITFLVDDIPNDSEIKQDLKFFEENFTGIMPLEILVNTQKKRGALQLRTLQRVATLQDSLAKNPNISYPLSVVNFVRASRQAFYNHAPAFYELPNQRDQAFLLRYMRNSGFKMSPDKGEDPANPRFDLLQSMVDTSGQKLRVSLKIGDIGSNEIKDLVYNDIQPLASEVFEGSDITFDVTGASLLFVRGNQYLINNLMFSMFLAFCIIAVIMGFLFRNFRMILVSLIPNLIPLLMTAGIMGIVGIPLKPSTAIIFSIAFGISVDDSIHFLAKYRQELSSTRYFVPQAVSRSLRETGASMIYTSLILFFGFIIFVGSSFGGTVWLGLLTSITLLIAMFTNLTLLPALLLSFDKRSREINAKVKKIEFQENGHSNGTGSSGNDVEQASYNEDNK